jgi:hypothetical protein
MVRNYRLCGIASRAFIPTGVKGVKNSNGQPMNDEVTHKKKCFLSVILKVLK